MWQKLVQNHEPMDDFELESQAYDYTLGEPLPSKPDYSCSDGGLLIRIKVPTLLYEWETSLEDKGEPLFQIYKYHPKSVDEAVLYYEEIVFGLLNGDQRIPSRIYLSPGRYYFRLSHCKFTISNTTSFITDNSFIEINESPEGDKIPLWSDLPHSKEWRAFYSLKFKIRKADLYLGFETKMLADHQLLFGAFYHSPDPDGIIRTFIFDGKNQLIEGQKI